MADFITLLDALTEQDVAFVVIGGLAAVAHGSAHVTNDLDLCYARTPENCARLVAALAPYRPTLRGAPADLPFRWDPRTLLAGLNFTLDTTAGPIDLFGEVPGLGPYAGVRELSQEMLLGSLPCLVLDLEPLIRAKRSAGRPKDLLVLPELEALLALQRSGLRGQEGGQP